MTLLAQPVDFTDRDFDSLRLRLQNLIRSVFPEWTDFNVANFGNILIELFAFTGDVLTFYQDNQAQQGRIATTTQRKAMLGLIKLIGFTPSGATAATVDEKFTLAAPPISDVVFLKGTIVKTAAVTDPVEFQLLADLTIPAALDPPEATGSIENSETRNEAVASTGLANQEIALENTPFVDGSAIISASNGDYSEVSSFLDSTSTDRHFTVTVDQNDRATIRFGNGINGVVPSGTISSEYKTGGGATGNVNDGTITTIPGAFTDTFGNPVAVTVTNLFAAAGGTNRQTIEQIRALAPESIKTLNRTVTREDFETNALRVAGVARALMLTSNEDVTIGENQGILFIIPEGGGVPSQALKDAVEARVTVTEPHTLTFVVSVQDTIFKTINVVSTIFIKSGSTPATVAAAVRSNLTSFFAESLADSTPNPNVDFGFNVKDASGDPIPEIAWSDVHNVVRDTVGVRKVGDEDVDFLLNGFNNDVALDVKEFPSLGTITLTDGDTGNPL